MNDIYTNQETVALACFLSVNAEALRHALRIANEECSHRARCAQDDLDSDQNLLGSDANQRQGLRRLVATYTSYAHEFGELEREMTEAIEAHENA